MWPILSRGSRRLLMLLDFHEGWWLFWNLVLWRTQDRERTTNFFPVSGISLLIILDLSSRERWQKVISSMGPYSSNIYFYLSYLVSSFSFWNSNLEIHNYTHTYQPEDIGTPLTLGINKIWLGFWRIHSSKGRLIYKG